MAISHQTRPANEPSAPRIGLSRTRLRLTCARLGSFSEIKSILGLGSSRPRIKTACSDSSRPSAPRISDSRSRLAFLGLWCLGPFDWPRIHRAALRIARAADCVLLRTCSTQKRLDGVARALIVCYNACAADSALLRTCSTQKQLAGVARALNVCYTAQTAARVLSDGARCQQRALFLATERAAVKHARSR